MKECESRQLGVNYRLTPQFTLTFAPIVTRGYESSKRDVRIEGAGILGGMNYRVSEGPLQGMNFFLAADKGREKARWQYAGRSPELLGCENEYSV